MEISIELGGCQADEPPILNVVSSGSSCDRFPRLSTDDCDSAKAAFEELLRRKPRRSTEVLAPLPGISSEGEFDDEVPIDVIHDSVRSRASPPKPDSDKHESGLSESGLLRSESGSGKRFKKMPTRMMPDDHWRDGNDAFRHEEEKKRNENLQQAVMHSNNNGWTHTRLFFSHCW